MVRPNRLPRIVPLTNVAATQRNLSLNMSIFIRAPWNLIGRFWNTHLLSRMFRICGAQAYWAPFYSQLQFIGVLLGTISFGSLADCFGRKPIAIFVLTWGISFSIISGKPRCFRVRLLFLLGLAPTWYILLATRLCIGFSIGGTIVVVCTFVMEMILPQQRMALRKSCKF